MAASTHDITMNFTANTSQAEEAVKRLKNETDKAAGSLDKQAKSSGTAAYALTNFNRVVQDAPFGIMGVANNIDPLVQSFQKLKAETGSTGGAFKEMMKTLSGPTGVLLGINMVIFALQVLPGLLKKISVSSLDVTKDFKAMRDSIIAKGVAQDEDVKKLTTQKVAIDTVSSALKQGTLSTQDKKYWIAELNKEYKPYLTQLKEHKANESNLSAALSVVNKELSIKINNMINEKVLEKMRGAMADKLIEQYDLRTKIQTGMNDLSEMTKKYPGLNLFDLYNTALDPRAMPKEVLEIKKKYGEIRDNLKLLDQKGIAYRKAVEELTKLTGNTNYQFGGSTTNDTIDPGTKEKTKEIKKLAEITIADLMRRTMLNYMGQFAKSKDMDALPTSALSGMNRSNGDFADPFTIDQSNVPWARKRDEGFKKLRDEAKQRADIYRDYFIDPFTNAFRGEFSKAWNSIFGEANSLLEKFIQNLGEQLFNLGVQKLATGIMNLILPGSGDIVGAASGGGSNRSINLFIGNELVATEKTAMINKAIIDRQTALL